MNEPLSNRRLAKSVPRRIFLQQAACSAGTTLAFYQGLFTANAAGQKTETGRLALKAEYDRKRSPFTGYVRQHWLEIAERLLAGILPFFDRQTGMPELRGTAGDRGHVALYRLNPIMSKWQAMERIMMLAVYYSAATGRDQVPGWKGSLTEVFRAGIRRMTNPKDPLFCPRTDPSVYMGSETALAIMLSPKLFWDPLSAAEKENVLNFLGELAHMKAYDNNHHLFHMVPVPLLERHGRPSNRAHFTALLEKMLEWHRGSGWLVDGNNRGFDHYNFWGFQLYLNALCHLDPTWQKQFGSQFRTITELFLLNAPFFFGRDGGPIPWGRSLAYRFADNSAIGWAHLNRANPLPPGLARRMASGCLKYFWDRGALDESGVLELGYHQANAVVAENYLTDGTGYFAAQGLACLLIPESDPFWTDRELPMPADQSGGRIKLTGAELVVRISATDGEARLFPVGQPFAHEGQWQRGVKYCQHSYSSYLGWCARGEGSEELGAGRTGFSLDGRNWIYRSHPSGIQVRTDRIASAYPMESPQLKLSHPAAKGRIITHTLIGDTGEIHIFWHDGTQPVYLYLGGYGINVQNERALKSKANDQRIHIQGEDKHSWMELWKSPPGRFEIQLLAPREGWRHSHLFGGRGVFPEWRTLAPVAPFTPVIAYVDGCRDRQPKSPALQVRLTAEAVEIEFEKRPHSILLKT